MNNKINSKIDLKDFIPEKIQSGKLGNKYDLHIKELEDKYFLYYFTNVSNWKGPNVGKRRYSSTITKKVSRNSNLFGVLGLLQGEMSKTFRGGITFANSESVLIQKVMDWFDKEQIMENNIWRGYIKVNINNPKDSVYKKQIEEKVINYWLKETNIDSNKRYPTTVSYIKNTKHKVMKKDDFGTLIIEKKSNIIAQVIRNFVRKITHEIILDCDFDEILHYIKGIVAAESTVELNYDYLKYRVFITAVEKSERDIYQKCLEKLGISSKQYKNYKDLVISRRKNNFKLNELGLMNLNPTKYKKFKKLISIYSSKKSENYILKEKNYSLNENINGFYFVNSCLNSTTGLMPFCT
jgi:hypothetical protein